MAALADDGMISEKELSKAAAQLGIDPGKLNPAIEGPAQIKTDAHPD